MALESIDITSMKVRNYIGIPSNSVIPLVDAITLNPYSYYAPGQLDVDADKNITLTPPLDSVFKKIGDFRLYNRNAEKPSIQNPSSWIGWGPSYGTSDFTMLYKLNELNLYAFQDRGDYVTIDFYVSPADRISGGGRVHRQLFTIPVIVDIPLILHTRQSPYKVNTTGWITCSITGFDNTWLPDYDTTIYIDMYISDMANNRKINFGTTISDGYSSLVLHRYQTPYIYGSNNNIPSPPSGYTAIFPAISINASPVCAYSSTMDQIVTDTTFSFYLVAKGIYSSTARIVALTSVDIILTLDGVRTVIATGVSLTHNSGYYCSGSLASSGVWHYDHSGAITFENGVIASTPVYTQC